MLSNSGERPSHISAGALQPVIQPNVYLHEHSRQWLRGARASVTAPPVKECLGQMMSAKP